MYALQEKNGIKFSESNLAVTGQVNSENYNNNSKTRNWMNFDQMLLQLKRKKIITNCTSLRFIFFQSHFLIGHLYASNSV